MMAPSARLPYRLLLLALTIQFATYGQTQVGQINASGALLYEPTSIATWGNYAIVASQGSNVLEIIDVSDPANPVHVNSVTSQPNVDQFLGVTSVAVAGNLAYAVNGIYMTIVDVTNPLAPTVLSSTKINLYGMCENCSNIYLKGNYAFVINNAAIIYDVSNAAAPVELGKVTVTGQGWNTGAVAGNYMYLGNYSQFEIVDVSNPSQPTVTGTLTDGTGGASFQFISSIAVSGNYAFVASSNSQTIESIDISNPNAPAYTGKIIDGQGGALLYNPSSIDIVGTYAYVASRFSNALEIIDITNPAALVHAGSITHGTGGAILLAPVSVKVSNHLAYVACNHNNIEIVDVTTPTAPTHKGVIADGATGGGAKLDGASALAVSGNYAYVQSIGSNALEIVDISNPASPVHSSSLPSGDGNSIFLSGNFLYRAWYMSMDILDISNPLAPVVKGAISNGQGGAALSNINSIFVQGNYAYVVSANAPAALEIVDISNPSSPTHVGSSVIDPGSGSFSYPTAVVVSGNYAYIADFGASVIEVFDVHTPTAPVQVATLSDGQGGAHLYGVYSIAVKGTYLYIASPYAKAFEIIDILNPATPTHASSMVYGQGGDANSFPQSIALSGNYAFLWSTDKLEVVDITDPYQPLHAGSAPTFWGAYVFPGNNVVAAQGNYVYTTGNNGLHVFSIASPAPVVATSASNISSNGFTANWNAAVGVTGYQVDVSTDNFNTFVSGYNNASASNTSLQIVGLAANTTYQYRVRSVDGAGSSLNSNIVAVTTLLAAPVATNATYITQTSFSANWNSVSGATSYILDIAADQSFNTILLSTTTPSTALAVYKRHDSTTYWIRVRAKNVQSTSAVSNVVQVTTQPRKQQSITFSLSNVVIGDAPFTLKAKASSGLPTKYVSSDTTVAVVKDSTFSIKKIGPCTITALQSGDSIYKAASAHQTICVSPLQPTISVSGSDPNFVLSSSAVAGNQWFANGSLIPSATSQTLTVSSSGSYAVQVVVNGCSSLVSAERNLVITGDIARSGMMNVNLYPNPATNSLFIDLTSVPADAPVSIEVTDMLGRNLDRQTKSGSSVVEVNVSNYPSGIYLINVGGQVNARGKFVKE